MLSDQAKVEFQKANSFQLGTNGLFKRAELIHSKLSVVITYQYFENISLLQQVLHVLSMVCAHKPKGTHRRHVCNCYITNNISQYL